MASSRHPTLALNLPLSLEYQPQHRSVVKQHWNVTFARQAKMSVTAKRILARVLDQIRDDDFLLREYYQLAITDITESAGINRDNAYREIESALRDLAAASWEFKSIDTEQWHIRHLLDTTKETPVGYSGGTVTVLLNPQLAPYFLQLAHYTTYRLDSYLKLRSWYSMRLYEILAAFRDTGFWEVSIEEYRKLLDCWHQTDKRGRVVKDKEGMPKLKYPNVNDLIRNTTIEPQAELAETELAFQLVPRHETARAGRGRRRIVGLRFELLRPQLTTIPPAWLTHPVTGPIIEKLRAWKVSDKNIALYATVLQRAGITKIIRGWEQKQVSQRAIDSPEKYCNAAFVRAAKAIIEEQKVEALQIKQDLQLGLFAGNQSNK